MRSGPSSGWPDFGDGKAPKIGLFEQAHAGTLLLDEISDMPLAAQSRILRVLVDQRFRRRNGRDDVTVDVRVISTTARDLRSEIQAGRFREDLFYRLNIVSLTMPPLRERRDDIPELAEYLLARVDDHQPLLRRSHREAGLAVLLAPDVPAVLLEMGFITNPAQVGGYQNYTGKPYVDTDGDGLPDAWETAHGLNPKDATDAVGDLNGDGYTNIEDFINGLDPRAPKTDWADLKNNIDRRNLPAPSAKI